MRGKDPVLLSSALKKYLETYPHRRQLKRGMILSLWPEIVGASIALQCRNLNFQGSKLMVHVANPGWRHELHMQRFSIMKKLNAEVGEDVISEIVVKA